MVSSFTWELTSAGIIAGIGRVRNAKEPTQRAVSYNWQDRPRTDCRFLGLCAVSSFTVAVHKYFHKVCF